MVTPQKSKTEYWPEKEFSEVARNLGSEELDQLYFSLKTSGVDDSYIEAIEEVFYEGKVDRYEEAREGIRELAKEELSPEKQPEWAWSVFSQQPDELDYELLEVPSGGENKGMLVDRELNEIFLYPKKADGVPGTDHVETWRLSVDNVRSAGGEWAGDEYEGASMTFMGDIVVDAVRTEFNQEMVMNDSLLDYFNEKVGGEEAGRYSSTFNSRSVDEMKGENWIEKWAGEQEQEDGSLETWLEEEAEKHAKTPEEIKNQGRLEFLIEEGYFTCAGVEDFNYTTGNIAFLMPESVAEMSPEEAYENAELIFVDAGEVEVEQEGPNSPPFIEQNLSENPFVDQEDVKLDDNEDEVKFNGGRSFTTGDSGPSII